MPIRTNRGRAAVYRKIWGWPLRSPKHLVGAVLVVVAVAVTLGVLLSQNRQAGPQQDTPPRLAGPSFTVTAPRGTAAPVGPAPSAPSGPPDRVTRTPTPSSAPPSPRALAVAEKWTRAWVHHPKGVSNKAWLDGMRPYTTPEYLPTMRSVNPANVPATRVTGKATADRSFSSSVRADVPTNGGALRLTVIRTPRGWLVAGYDKA